MLTQDELKQNVAREAVQYILPLLDSTAVVGVGTGSTVDFFIDELAKHKTRFRAAVSSSSRHSVLTSSPGTRAARSSSAGFGRGARRSASQPGAREGCVFVGSPMEIRSLMLPARASSGST